MIGEREQQQATESLSTVRDWLRWAETVVRREPVFLGHGTDNYWDEALALVLPALSLPWDVDPNVLDGRLLPDERAVILDWLKRRVNERVPAPYITGTAWFCGLPFHVDERVLIPRSPLGEAVDNRFEPFVAPDQVHRILDLCTGCGALAVASALAFPEAEVDATDVSEEALAVCRANLAEHGVAGQVTLHQLDGLEGLDGGYDLIICNPPYVDAEDMATLPPEYRHEPELALAAGEDGLDFTRALLRRAPDYLTENGMLVVEVGNSAAALEQRWPDVPFMWLAFERGGDGAFCLSRADLLAHRHRFEQAA